ncbi:MAG: rhodanese-related sulfurtransferase [Pseudomonadota bacterium]
MARQLVAALYKFVPLPDYVALRERVRREAEAHNLTGSLLLAEEGVNGTIAGEPGQLRHFLGWLRTDARLADLEWKESWASHPPFGRLKVRLKREIVSMGAPDIVSNESVGAYVEPEDWNDLISQPDVVVVDTRNDYEVAIGQFEGAVDPKTATFRDFPAWAQEASALANKPRVAMYCTGGIRCEKATAYLRAQGFEEVHHLRGGILKYLETVPPEQSLWRGECFVFDERVAVGHGLREGPYELCRGCRRPISPEDKLRSDYEAGVSCHWCADEITDEQREGRRERQRQIALTTARQRAVETPSR